MPNSIFPSNCINVTVQPRRPKPFQALHRRKRRRSRRIRLLARARIDAGLKFNNASAASVSFGPTLEVVIGVMTALASRNLRTCLDAQDVGEARPLIQSCDTILRRGILRRRSAPMASSLQCSFTHSTDYVHCSQSWSIIKLLHIDSSDGSIESPIHVRII